MISGRSALGLLAVCVCAYAQTRDLRSVPVPRQHDPLYVDPATVVRSAGQVAFSYVLDVPVALDAPGRPRRWRSNEMTAVIDCARNTYSIDKVIAYSAIAATGNVVGRHSSTAEERKPAPIVRDSTVDFLARHLCKAQPPTPR